MTKHMKNYNFSFTGRQSGAIGIFYKISQEYTAKDIKHAVTMLYTDYEHISGLKLNNKPFKAQAEHFIKIDYKGLGMNRK